MRKKGLLLKVSQISKRLYNVEHRKNEDERAFYKRVQKEFFRQKNEQKITKISQQAKPTGTFNNFETFYQNSKEAVRCQLQIDDIFSTGPQSHMEKSPMEEVSKDSLEKWKYIVEI